MDDPVQEITGVIETLCTAESEVQQQAIDRYFTENAQFVHPFCRTIPVSNSKWMIKKIYACFDQANLILYVAIHQTFRIQFVPFYKAQPTLVTKLQLTHARDTRLDTSYSDIVKRAPGSTASAAQKYYILSQNDLYQTNEFIKFLLPWGIGSTAVFVWQVFSTFMCILGAMFFWPLTWIRENILC